PGACARLAGSSAGARAAALRAREGRGAGRLLLRHGGLAPVLCRLLVASSPSRGALRGDAEVARASLGRSDLAARDQRTLARWADPGSRRCARPGLGPRPYDRRSRTARAVVRGAHAPPLVR